MQQVQTISLQSIERNINILPSLCHHNKMSYILFYLQLGPLTCAGRYKLMRPFGRTSNWKSIFCLYVVCDAGLWVGGVQENGEECQHTGPTNPLSIGRIVPDKTETHVESIPANVFSRELLRPIDTGFVVLPSLCHPLVTGLITGVPFHYVSVSIR